jgi:hypothetical protein
MHSSICSSSTGLPACGAAYLTNGISSMRVDGQSLERGRNCKIVDFYTPVVDPVRDFTIVKFSEKVRVTVCNRYLYRENRTDCGDLVLEQIYCSYIVPMTN